MKRLVPHIGSFARRNLAATANMARLAFLALRSSTAPFGPRPGVVLRVTARQIRFTGIRALPLTGLIRGPGPGNFAGTVLDLVTPGDPLDPDPPPAPPPGGPRSFLKPGMSLPMFVGVSLETLFKDACAPGRQLSGTLERTGGLPRPAAGPTPGPDPLDSVARDMESLMPELEMTPGRSRKILALAGETMEESRPRVATLLETANRDLEAVEDLAASLDGLPAEVESRAGTGLGRAGRVLGKMEQALHEERSATIPDNPVTASREADLLVTELRKRPWWLLRRVRGEKKALIRELEPGGRPRRSSDEESSPPSP